MATVLALTEAVEDGQRMRKYSEIEGEILVLLRRPVRFPQTIKENLNELTPLFPNTKFGKGPPTFLMMA